MSFNHFTIELPEHFNYDLIVEHLKKQEKTALFKIENHNILRLIQNDCNLFLIKIKNNDSLHLDVKILDASIEPTKKDFLFLRSFIRKWFDLDRDLTPLYKMANRDPILKPFITRFYGLRLVGFPNLFEALSWAIIGQQINLSFANSLKQQFIQTFGENITYNKKNYWTFPSINRIANLQKSDMEGFKMTERKKEYLINIATLFTKNIISEQTLLQMKDPRKIKRKLMDIRGIGPWTADYVLMRYFRVPTTYPIDDAGLINAIQQVKNLEGKPSKQDIKTLFSKWTGWESYVTFYLWESLY